MADTTEIEDTELETGGETTETNTDTGAESNSEQSLFDAVNAALEPPKDGEETDAEGKDGEGDAEVDLDAEDAAKAAAAAAGKGAPDDKAGGKKPDAVNDPIPEGVNARTKERMESLIGLVKQKDALIESQHGILNAITNTGASPQEFGAMIGYMSWVRSDDPKKLTMARDLLLQELEGVSLKLGEAAPGIDFISKHPDIQAMVQAGQITQEAAIELAITRSRKAVADERARIDAERTATETAANKEREIAIANLNTFGNQLAKTDADYARKFEFLKTNGILETLRELPVAKWKDSFLRAYNRVPAAPAAAAPAKASKVGTPAAKTALPQGRNGNGQYNGTQHRPLRASAPAGASGAKAPGSALDAMNAALENMG